MSNARYNPLKTAKKRGWSSDDLSKTSLAGAPRHGFKWNDEEHRDLALSYLTAPVEERNETPFLFKLADAHGRAYSGITSRLQKLRLDDSRVVLGVGATLEYDGRRVRLCQHGVVVMGVSKDRLREALAGQVHASNDVRGMERTRLLEALKVHLKSAISLAVLAALFPQVATLAQLMALATSSKYNPVTIEPDTGRVTVKRHVRAHPALAAPYEHINCRSSTAPLYTRVLPFEPAPQHLAVLRVLTHLEAQCGKEVWTNVEALQGDTPSGRLALVDLRRHGLIGRVDGHGTLPETYGLTDAGRAAVVDASRKEEAARAEADAAAACPAEYHVVVRAGLKPIPAWPSRRRLEHAPNVCHATREAAEAEAERLAAENPGEAFHVLSTVAVAESVQRTAVRQVR